LFGEEGGVGTDVGFFWEKIGRGQEGVTVRSMNSQGVEVSSMKSVKWEVRGAEFEEGNFGFIDPKMQIFDSKKDFMIPVNPGSDGKLVVEIEFWRYQTLHSIIPLDNLHKNSQRVLLENKTSLFPKFT
jgi:hypothetical protein